MRTRSGGSLGARRAAGTGHAGSGISIRSSVASTRSSVRAVSSESGMPGTGSAAMEPIISGGAGNGIPSADASRAWPASASSWFEAMRAGQPPGRSAPMTSIAAAIER